MARFRLQSLCHITQYVIEGLNPNLSIMAVQNLHKSGHVSALEVVGEIDVHVEISNSVLLTTTAIFNSDWMTYVFDSYLIYRNMAGIFTALNVSNLWLCGRAFRQDSNPLVMYWVYIWAQNYGKQHIMSLARRRRNPRYSRA